MTAAVRLRVSPGAPLQGRLRVPGDKSISHRALMLGAIARGETRVSGLLQGEDVLATMAAMRALGVRIDHHGDAVLIHGAGRDGLKAPQGPLDLGNSGTSMRLLMGLLAGQPFEAMLTGDASLTRRPMERVASPLREMGADIVTAQGGTPPVRVRGSRCLAGIDYRMPLASAQVKSALLLAGLYATGRTCVTEPAPTRDHTERMLAGFGCAVERAGRRACVAGGAALTGCRVDVPADFSSAAFFLVGASIVPGSRVRLEHVGLNPTRTGLLDTLRRMGADIDVLDAREVAGEPVADLEVRSAALTGIDVPADAVSLMIDEFPALFVAAACARGTTRVTGAEELRHKESDRIGTMAAALSALGVRTEELADGLVVHGGPVRGGTVDSTGDHRVAMAMAMLAMRASAPVTIGDCRNVATSFPGFGRDAARLGMDIETLP